MSINVVIDNCESDVQMLWNKTGANQYGPFLTFKLQDWRVASLHFQVKWQWSLTTIPLSLKLPSPSQSVLLGQF